MCYFKNFKSSLKFLMEKWYRTEFLCPCCARSDTSRCGLSNQNVPNRSSQPCSYKMAFPWMTLIFQALENCSIRPSQHLGLFVMFLQPFLDNFDRVIARAHYPAERGRCQQGILGYIRSATPFKQVAHCKVSSMYQEGFRAELCLKHPFAT